MLSEAEAFLLGRGGKAHVEEGWSNDVEDGCVIAAGGEKGEKLGDF